jgi:hypothetical protein
MEYWVAIPPFEKYPDSRDLPTIGTETHWSM